MQPVVERSTIAVLCDDIGDLCLEAAATGRVAFSVDQQQRCTALAARSTALGFATLADSLTALAAQLTPDNLLRTQLLVDRLADERDIDRLPARGFSASRAEFAAWADGRGRRRLLMEDFYRDNRRRLGLLMDGAEPVGGRWNFDAENREPPP